VGRLLEHAATTSLNRLCQFVVGALDALEVIAHARATACSTGLGSGAMAIFGVFAGNSPDSSFWEQRSGESTGTEGACDQLLLLRGGVGRNQLITE